MSFFRRFRSILARRAIYGAMLIGFILWLRCVWAFCALVRGR